MILSIIDKKNNVKNVQLDTLLNKMLKTNPTANIFHVNLDFIMMVYHVFIARIVKNIIGIINRKIVIPAKKGRIIIKVQILVFHVQSTINTN